MHGALFNNSNSILWISPYFKMANLILASNQIYDHYNRSDTWLLTVFGKSNFNMCRSDDWFLFCLPCFDPVVEYCSDVTSVSRTYDISLIYSVCNQIPSLSMVSLCHSWKEMQYINKCSLTFREKQTVKY